MNASLRVAVLSLAVLSFAGCKSMEEKSTYVPESKAPTILDNDELYMATVERIARRRGIDLLWVNPPRAQVAQKDDDQQ